MSVWRMCVDHYFFVYFSELYTLNGILKAKQVWAQGSGKYNNEGGTVYMKRKSVRRVLSGVLAGTLI